MLKIWVYPYVRSIQMILVTIQKFVMEAMTNTLICILVDVFPLPFLQAHNNLTSYTERKKIGQQNLMYCRRMIYKAI